MFIYVGLHAVNRQLVRHCALDDKGRARLVSSESLGLGTRSVVLLGHAGIAGTKLDQVRVLLTFGDAQLAGPTGTAAVYLRAYRRDASGRKTISPVNRLRCTLTEWRSARPGNCKENFSPSRQTRMRSRRLPRSITAPVRQRVRNFGRLSVDLNRRLHCVRAADGDRERATGRSRRRVRSLSRMIGGNRARGRDGLPLGAGRQEHRPAAYARQRRDRGLVNRRLLQPAAHQRPRHSAGP